MTRVNTSDRVLLLLRERLQRRERAKAPTAGRTEFVHAATRPPVTRLQALLALDRLPADELKRMLVDALLAHEVGDAVANGPAFQAIAERVFRLIDGTPEGRDLIERATREFRASA